MRREPDHASSPRTGTDPGSLVRKEDTGGWRGGAVSQPVTLSLRGEER